LPPGLPPPPVDAAAELEATDDGGDGGALDVEAGGATAIFSSTLAGGVGAPWPAVTVTTTVSDSQTTTSAPRMLAGPAIARR